MSHELRAPLNTIHGYLDLILMGAAGEVNEQQREYITRARTSSEYLYSLLEDFLFLARADAGQLRLHCALAQLPEILTAAIEQVELTARDRQVSICTQCPDDFPPIYADALRLQHLLRNLLHNGLQHTTGPGMQITVSAEVLPNTFAGISPEHERIAVLQVCDNGPALSIDHPNHLFERLYQPSDGNGTLPTQGPGLPIVKMITELHGGFMQASSVAEYGTTFTCILPCLLV